ncbi:hypothetical protein ACFSKW_27070 [Nonomuraea mangrovi]|uniref:DISARM protein DrmE C-terminal domain-containing protein n=1 Tax=Nonomuraea mangrovi TaxID=2316207 RepID=A0ABW4T1V8_9ACTN
MDTWDGALIRSQVPTSLVGIARQGRLARDYGNGPKAVGLSEVDETALALIDLAAERRKNLALVYPAPAGEVSVLLAAQLLLQRFQRHEPLPAIGIVTADTTRAAHTWERLSITTHGEHVKLSEVFACFRAGPNGEAPHGGRRVRGLIVGERSVGWDVDGLIEDHLAGAVQGGLKVPSVELYADPLDPRLESAATRGVLVWGWPESELTHGQPRTPIFEDQTPFSVAHERLRTLAEGVSVAVEISRHDDAEAAIRRAREDLRVLRELAGPHPTRNIRKGLSVAWHHLSTLTALPCRPLDFDRFASLPPIGARKTSAFAAEIVAWARTLEGDLSEIAALLAGDLDELRAVLDLGHPFLHSLTKIAEQGPESVAIVKTRTAARALAFSLCGDPNARDLKVGSLSIVGMSKLHRSGSYDNAIIVGVPAKWDWHRVDSGLARSVRVLVLGREDGRVCGKVGRALKRYREHWGSPAVRGETWRALLRCEPPPAPHCRSRPDRLVVLDDREQFVQDSDPFDALGSLSQFEPLRIGEEGIEESLAVPNEQGGWIAEVPALRVETDLGSIMLEVGRHVEVRDGRTVTERQPERLVPGMRLLIGRKAGRLGLLEALEERLHSRRPDLVVGRLLIDDLHQRIRARLRETDLTCLALHERLERLGCDKGIAAVRGWVSGASTLAPRDLSDLCHLNNVLDLELSETRLKELFAAVRRWRGFRRSAGRALAEAARASTVPPDHARTDGYTGLSIADLREAVIEANVIRVASPPIPTPLAEIGHLETS